MPIFAYRALAFDGEVRRGEEAAESYDHLRDILAGRDLILKTATANQMHMRVTGARIPLKDLAAFNRQFVVLLKAGVTIPEALSTLSIRPRQPRLERALRLVLAEVRQGTALSAATEKISDAFEAPYRAMIATGEHAGALAECLERYQSYMELRLKIAGQVSRALVYPIVLLVTLAAVLAFLFVAVIPSFVTMYRDLGSALPWPTQLLITASQHFVGVGIALVSAIGATIAAERIWISRPDGRIARDRLLAALPLIGHVRRTKAAAETARILATLLQSGSPLSRALTVASASVTDRHVGKCLAEVNAEVASGRSLMAALTPQHLLPPESLQMLAAGERGGSLGPMLTEIATYHEADLEHRLARLMSLAEPLLILFAGLMVGSIIVAMYLPIFSLTDAIR